MIKGAAFQSSAICIKFAFWHVSPLSSYRHFPYIVTLRHRVSLAFSIHHFDVSRGSITSFHKCYESTTATTIGRNDRIVPRALDRLEGLFDRTSSGGLLLTAAILVLTAHFTRFVQERAPCGLDIHCAETQVSGKVFELRQNTLLGEIRDSRAHFRTMKIGTTFQKCLHKYQERR